MSKESAHLKAEPMNEAPWKTNEWTTHRLRLELLRAQKITQYFPPLAECSLILKPGMLIPTPSGVGSESIIYVLLLLGRPPVRLLACGRGCSSSPGQAPGEDVLLLLGRPPVRLLACGRGCSSSPGQAPCASPGVWAGMFFFSWAGPWRGCSSSPGQAPCASPGGVLWAPILLLGSLPVRLLAAFWRCVVLSPISSSSSSSPGHVPCASKSHT